MKDPVMKNGNFFSPMVLENIDTDSPSWTEEFFGPVFNIFKATSQKNALDLANKSDYGLSAAVFTQNEEKLEHAAHRLRVGTVFLNEMSTSGSDFPGGGIKGSGFGRECYIDGLVEMANRKPIIRGDK
jgi:succinate-semialdehyde dehydrogenase/glutarate-semialdehyde dehydrogenase